MSDHFLIEFEPLASPTLFATLDANAPMAFAVLGDIDGPVSGFAPMAEALLLDRHQANAPAATAKIVVTGTTGATPLPTPAINTIFAYAPMAYAHISNDGEARMFASAPMARADFGNYDGTAAIHGFAPMAEAYIRDQPFGLDAFFVLAYAREPWMAMWLGNANISLSERLVISTTSAISQIIVLRERLGIGASNVSLISTVLSLTDSVLIRDAVSLVWQVLLEEVVELGSTAEQFLTAVIRATERLRLSGVVSSEREAIVALAETLALADSGQYTWLAELLETMELGDAIEARIQAMVSMLETLALADSTDMTLTATAALREEVVVGVSAGTQLEASVVLREALELVGTLRINGDVYSCWLINTESKGIARYTNYPFNSFARWPGTKTYIGATDTGLHELGGDTDAGEPIRAAIRSALTDFGSRQLKRVPTMYLGYTTSGETLVLKVIHTSETGAKTEDWYRLEGRNAPEVREDRFKVGRGIASVFLGFEIVNVNGADFALDVVEWQPIRLDRKVR